ncbi:MAG: HEAT repeat domain-containing protein [Pirellulaceae bacterium]
MKLQRIVIACLCGAGLLLGGSAWGAEASLAELIAGLKSPQEATRVSAIDHLAAQGELASEAAGPLSQLLEDKSPTIRAHAAYALGRIGAAAKPAVPALVELLKDSDDTVRQQAVKAVIAIHPGPQVTIPLAVKLLEDSDPAVRQRVLHAISQAGAQATPGLIEALKNDKACYWACLVLRDIGPAGKDAIPALAEKLKDARPEIRREAALALGAMDQQAADAAPQLAALLSDEHAALAATYALGRIGRIPPDAETKMVENAKSEDKLLSTTSMWALANTHPDNKQLRAQVTTQLIGRLSDDDALVRVAAARALAALPPMPEVTLPIWDKALEGADETTVAHSLDALVRLGKPAAAKLAEALQYEKLRPQVLAALRILGPDAAAATMAVAKLVDSPNPRDTRDAVLTLATIGPGARDAVPVLVAALGKEGAPNAHSIAYALGEMGPAAKEAREVLLKQVAGSNADLSLISAWSLNKIDPSAETAAKTVPALVAGLSAETAHTRHGAAESLGAMGPLAKEAIPALQRAAKDADPSVREAAATALAQIQK